MKNFELNKDNLSMEIVYKLFPWLKGKDIDYCIFDLYFNYKFITPSSKRKYLDDCYNKLNTMNRINNTIKVYDFGFGIIRHPKSTDYNFKGINLLKFIYYRVVIFYMLRTFKIYEL